jgi:pimeloyl-ACP methyl ester carboxylesterase
MTLQSPSLPATFAEPQVLPLKRSTIKIAGQPAAVERGALRVPENRGRADAREIEIPIVRYRSRSAQPADPIFWLDGGPGMSNLSFKPPVKLLDKHDVVLVGYRGADGSSILKCPEIARALKGVDGDVLSAASRANLQQGVAHAAQNLQAAGVDLGGYTIAEVVADLEAAREALGYDRVNLLSASYGTRVAQIYAHLHPDRITRSIMIGVNPPGHFVWLPDAVDAKLADFAAAWARDPQCAAHTPDLLASLRRALHNLPRRWLLFPIDPGYVKLMTFVLLYQRPTAALAIDALLAAERGDASGVWLMAFMGRLMLGRMMIWGDLLAKGGSADYEPGRDYAAELDRPEAILGAPLSLLIWGAINDGWPLQLLPAELRRVQPSDVPTLLISGELDVATPAEPVERELRPALSHGQHIVLPNTGHVPDMFRTHPAGMAQLLSAYFATGEVDTSALRDVPLDFHVKPSFTLMAKLGVGAVLMMIAAVMMIALSLLR